MFELIGKTVKKVEVAEIDHYGDGDRVGEAYKVETDDGETHYYISEGGDTGFYATVCHKTEEEFDEFMDEEGTQFSTIGNEYDGDPIGFHDPKSKETLKSKAEHALKRMFDFDSFKGDEKEKEQVFEEMVNQAMKQIEMGQEPDPKVLEEVFEMNANLQYEVDASIISLNGWNVK